MSTWQKIAKHLLFWCFAIICFSAFVTYLKPFEKETFQRYVPKSDRSKSVLAKANELDEIFADKWEKAELKPADSAEHLVIARRLSLALTGSIPSYEEIAKLQDMKPIDDPAEFTQYWLTGILDNPEDTRFADYFAERFVRAYAGNEEGAFLVFRRRRFRVWLSEQFAKPFVNYGHVVRRMVAGDGIWTETPEVNFITSAIEGGTSNNQPNPDLLAGKVSRAFLGMRLDCAQCHDHPFEQWTQDQYQELAAFFGQTSLSFKGIHEDPKKKFEVQDRETLEYSVVEPAVPFAQELLDPKTKNPRWQLANWITHKENKAFSRATVNRVWALMFGKGIVEPVDDLSSLAEFPPVLEFLADDFTEHDYDLKRLIRLIAASQVFQVDSAADHELTSEHEVNWACFPVTRLRPEQAIGSLMQATSLQTNDQENHILFRLIRYGETNDFIQRYGDAGADELVEQGGTIPQRLLLMNGKMTREKVKGELLSFVRQAAALIRDDQTAIDTAYLSCLSRKPTEKEREHFLNVFSGQTKNARVRTMEDLYWALINSSEFSWNH